MRWQTPTDRTNRRGVLKVMPDPIRKGAVVIVTFDDVDFIHHFQSAIFDRLAARRPDGRYQTRSQEWPTRLCWAARWPIPIQGA